MVDNRKVVTTEGLKKKYSPPALQNLGKISELTGALSSGTRECGNNGAQKGCRT